MVKLLPILPLVGVQPRQHLPQQVACNSHGHQQECNADTTYAAVCCGNSFGLRMQHVTVCRSAKSNLRGLQHSRSCWAPLHDLSSTSYPTSPGLRSQQQSRPMRYQHSQERQTRAATHKHSQPLPPPLRSIHSPKANTSLLRVTTNGPPMRPQYTSGATQRGLAALGMLASCCGLGSLTASPKSATCGTSAHTSTHRQAGATVGLALCCALCQDRKTAVRPLHEAPAAGAASARRTHCPTVPPGCLMAPANNKQLQARTLAMGWWF